MEHFHQAFVPLIDYVDAGVYVLGLQSPQRSMEAVKFRLEFFTFHCAVDSLVSNSDSDQGVGRESSQAPQC